MMPNGRHYTYKCDNCGRVYGPDEDIGEKITEKNWHMEPGSIVPYGACDCGGYIYAIDSPSKRFIKRHLESAAEEREALKEMEEEMTERLKGKMERAFGIPIEVEKFPQPPCCKIGCMEQGVHELPDGRFVCEEHLVTVGKDMAGKSFDATNYMIQSEFAARAFDGLMSMFSEEQRREFAATGCITIHVRPGLPMKKMPPDLFQEYMVKEAFNRDIPNLQDLGEFKPSFKISKGTLEAAAEMRPALGELLEKQVSEAALEELCRLFHFDVSVQRKAWKMATFGERYSTPHYLPIGLIPFQKALPWLVEMKKKKERP